jgi:phosphoglycolate phosphatase
MEVKGVVFDLDGTLVRFNLNYKAVRSEVRSYLVNAGIPASVLEVNESIFEMLKKTEIFTRNLRNTRLSFNEIRTQVFAITEKYELEAATDTSLFPGVNETLKTLKNLGLKLGLFTMNSGRAVDNILNRFRLTSFFDAVVPRDNVEYVKPHPQHLRAVLDSLGITAANALIVGDSPSDMHSAKELGAVSVGLTTGLTGVDELIRAGADYVATSITDLPHLVAELKGDTLKP